MSVIFQIKLVVIDIYSRQVTILSLSLEVKKSTFCYFVCTFPLERSEGFKKTKSKVKRPFVVLED